MTQSELQRSIDHALKRQADVRRQNRLPEPPDSKRYSMSRSQLMYGLTTGKLNDDDLRFIHLIEQNGIHNSATSRYARRILDSPELDRRGDSQWWVNEFAAMSHYHRPIEVIVAGLSLYQFVVEKGEEALPPDAEHTQAIRKLTFALCRIGSGGMGYAAEAHTTIARLGSVVSEYVAEFITKSPLGLWLGRAADGAIRRASINSKTYQPDRTAGDPGLMIHQYTKAALALRQDISPGIPAACTGHLRLLRRIAFSGASSANLSAAEELLTIAQNSALSPRWRRFSLWAACEHAIRYPDSPNFRVEFEHIARTLRSDRAVADVADMIIGRELEPRYLSFPSEEDPQEFDAFHHASIDGEGFFEWPLDNYPRTDRVLQDYTTRGHNLASASHRLANRPFMDGVGIDLRVRFLDALHEAIVHPGIVRTQAAIDMFFNSGPETCTAAVRTIEAVLVDGGVLANYQDHHPGVIETCVEILGGLRNQSAIEILISLADPRYGPFVHSRAIWAIGDILSDKDQPNLAESSSQEEIRSSLLSALDDSNISVQRAAMHTLAVTHAVDDEFRQIINSHTTFDDKLRSWATWCLASQKVGKDGFLNKEPYEM